jgi:hypothetical protein
MGIFIHKNPKINDDFYIFDSEGYSFDLLFLLCILLPIFFISFSFTFYFKFIIVCVGLLFKIELF